jgi:hypothetical protein
MNGDTLSNVVLYAQSKNSSYGFPSQLPRFCCVRGFILPSSSQSDVDEFTIISHPAYNIQVVCSHKVASPMCRRLC